MESATSLLCTVHAVSQLLLRDRIGINCTKCNVQHQVSESFITAFRSAQVKDKKAAELVLFLPTFNKSVHLGSIHDILNSAHRFL